MIGNENTEQRANGNDVKCTMCRMQEINLTLFSDKHKITLIFLFFSYAITVRLQIIRHVELCFGLHFVKFVCNAPIAS